MEIIVPWNWWVTQRGGRVHVCWDQECVPAISYTYKQGVLCILGEPNIEFRLEAFLRICGGVYCGGAAAACGFQLRWAVKN